MSKAGKRLIKAAHEAVAVARGEMPAARITMNGHTYVPAAFLTAEREALAKSLERTAAIHDHLEGDSAGSDGWHKEMASQFRRHAEQVREGWL